MAKDKQYPSETYPDTRGNDPEILRRYYGALDEYRQSLASGNPLPIEYLVAQLTTTEYVDLVDYRADLRQVEAEKAEIAAREPISPEEFEAIVAAEVKAELAKVEAAKAAAEQEAADLEAARLAEDTNAGGAEIPADEAEKAEE